MSGKRLAIPFLLVMLLAALVSCHPRGGGEVSTPPTEETSPAIHRPPPPPSKIIMPLPTSPEAEKAMAALPAKTFTSRKHGFSITGPKGWTMYDMGLFGTEVIFAGPIRDEYTSEVRVIVTPASFVGQVPPESLAAFARQEAARSVSNFKVVQETEGRLGGLAGRTIFYDGQDKGVAVSGFRTVAFKDGKLFSATGTAARSAFQELYPAMANCAASLKFLPPAKEPTAPGKKESTTSEPG